MRKLFYIYIILFLASCQMQQRKYRPGFYVHKNQASQNHDSQKTSSPRLLAEKSNSAIKPTVIKELNLQNPDSCDLLVFNDGTEIKVKIVEMGRNEIRYKYCDDKTGTVRMSRRINVVNIKYADGRNEKSSPSDANIPPVLPEKKPEPIQPDTTTKPAAKRDTNTGPCDLMVFRNGMEEKVKVMEIGVEDIRYKACDMPDGPTFVKKKSSVFMIVFPDGSREVFKEEAPKPAYQAPVVTKPYVVRKSGLAVTAFIFSLLGIFPLMYGFGSVPALIMGLIYKQKARANPEMYPAGKFAQTAIIISSIVIGIYIIALMIAFI